MKKLILFIGMFLMYTGQGFAQDSTTLTPRVVYEDLKVGVRDLAKEFKEVVSKLEGPAKYTYEAFVRKEVAEAITYIIISLLGMLCFVIAFWKNVKKADFTYCNLHATLSIIFGILSFGFIIFFVNSFCNNLPRLISPEYYAIENIINMLK